MSNWAGKRLGILGDGARQWDSEGTGLRSILEVSAVVNSLFPDRQLMLLIFFFKRLF